MTAIGTVWSMGAKEKPWVSGETMLQFILRFPYFSEDESGTAVRLWVQWRRWEFWPAPGQRLKVHGHLVSTKVLYRMTKPARVELVLVADSVEAV